MIKTKQKGSFKKTKSFLTNLSNIFDNTLSEKYGKRGIELLAEFTPKDTGKTAESWVYEVDNTRNGFVLHFYNTNIQNGTPVAIILNDGHLSKEGQWIPGSNYIEDAINELYNEIAKDIRRRFKDAKTRKHR